MIVVVAAQLMTVVLVLKTVVGVVHLRQQGLHLRPGLVARLQPPVTGLWMLLLRARYSLVLLKLNRTPDVEGCSLVDGLCLHSHHEQG
jgi:hypothetical protein